MDLGTGTKQNNKNASKNSNGVCHITSKHPYFEINVNHRNNKTKITFDAPTRSGEP